MFFEYWFMFFISIIVATIAMTFGIGGAVLFSPVFIILFPLVHVTPLDPANAFGAALLTEVAGFASGFIGYYRKKLIDFKTAKYFLMIGVPLVIVGTIIKRSINAALLTMAFAAGMLFLASYVYRMSKNTEIDTSQGMLRSIVDAEGTVHEYLVCNQSEGGLLAGIGSLTTGMISVGIGETVVSTLRGRCNLPMGVAAGTSVFVVIIVVLSSAVVDIMIAGIDAIPWTLVMFTIPGVLIGGQIGSHTSSKVSEHTAEKFLIGLFTTLSVVMGYIGLTKLGVF